MEKLPSFADFQRTQTELELKSITEQKLSNQVEEIRHELEMKCTELSNSQRDILKLKMQVCIKMMWQKLSLPKNFNFFSQLLNYCQQKVTIFGKERRFLPGFA